MSKVIDLTFPFVQEHWRWLVKLHRHPRFDPAIHHMYMECNLHSFTHVDSLLHFSPGSLPIEQVPLDKFMGEAAIVDLSHLGKNESVTAGDLEKHGQHVKADDIVLLRTDWPLKYDIMSRDFWGKAPYTERDACEWLIKRKVKTVGFDYPADYAIRYEVTDPQHEYKIEEFTTHVILFPAGIYHVDYLCNLHLITKKRVQFMALPIPLQGAEGSPVRAIAIEQ